MPKVLNRAVIDEIITVSDEDAYHMVRRLAREEGILVGISAGAACELRQRQQPIWSRDSGAVVVFPDTGERYLSTPELLMASDFA